MSHVKLPASLHVIIGRLGSRSCANLWQDDLTALCGAGSEAAVFRWLCESAVISVKEGKSEEQG